MTELLPKQKGTVDVRGVVHSLAHLVVNQRAPPKLSILLTGSAMALDALWDLCTNQQKTSFLLHHAACILGVTSAYSTDTICECAEFIRKCEIGNLAWFGARNEIFYIASIVSTFTTIGRLCARRKYVAALCMSSVVVMRARWAWAMVNKWGGHQELIERRQLSIQLVIAIALTKFVLRFKK